MSNLLTVTQFAKVCHVTPRTIRWYQEIGLLRPRKYSRRNKYAYFSPQQALEIFRIRILQQLDVPLQKIKTQPNSHSLNKQISELQVFIKQKQKEINFLKKLNEILYESDSQNLLKSDNFGPINLFCLKIEDGDYDKIDTYLLELNKFANQNGIETLGDGLTFYLDNEISYKPKNTPLEVAFATASPPRKGLPGNFYFRNIAKRTVLSYSFEAPNQQLHYVYLPLLYQKLDCFIQKNKINIKNPVFEVYRDSITQICYSI